MQVCVLATSFNYYRFDAADRDVIQPAGVLYGSLPSPSYSFYYLCGPPSQFAPPVLRP